MSGRGGRAARVWLALMTGALLVGPAASMAGAEEAPPELASSVTPETYEGGTYSADLRLPPTNTEGQSKLWFHDQSWWGLFSDPDAGSTVRVYQLMPDHTWRKTPAVVATGAAETGDAVEGADDVVHVVVRHSDERLYHVPLTYDATAGEYTRGTPQLVTTKGSLAPATIAEETTGRLWIAFATPYDVHLAYSDDGRTWSIILLTDTGTGRTQEAAALVAFGKNLGLMWSDQSSGSFFFAWHRSGAPPARWKREVALTGPDQADNHISLVRVPTDGPDIVAAAVKTSLGDVAGAGDAALIKVLVRAPDGTWSEATASTVADRLNDPVLQVDAATNTLHLLAAHRGRIVDKTAPIDDIRFEPGLGEILMLGTDGVLSYPTGSKTPATDRSGLVVMASDIKTRSYRHAELPLPASSPAEPDPEDKSPPDRPKTLQGRAAAPEIAVLSWDAAQDRGGWFPAAEGAPAAGYVIFRGGEEIGTTATTTFTDRPRTRSEATDALSVTYEVVSVDASGNRSKPNRVVVDLPAATTVNLPQLVGIGGIGAAVLIGLFAVRRLWVTQRPAPKDPPAGTKTVRETVGAGR